MSTLEFVGIYDDSEGIFVVDSETYRLLMGEAHYQMELAEKANAFNDERESYASILNDPEAEPRDVEFLRNRYLRSLDEACRWTISLRDLAGILGVDNQRPFKLRLQLAESKQAAE